MSPTIMLLALVFFSCFHFGYVIKMVEFSGANATATEQIGHSFVDVVAKVIFGIFIWAIIAGFSPSTNSLIDELTIGKFFYGSCSSCWFDTSMADMIGWPNFLWFVQLLLRHYVHR